MHIFVEDETDELIIPVNDIFQTARVLHNDCREHSPKQYTIIRALRNYFQRAAFLIATVDEFNLPHEWCIGAAEENTQYKIRMEIGTQSFAGKDFYELWLRVRQSGNPDIYQTLKIYDRLH